jgi:hypothetical protein
MQRVMQRAAMTARADAKAGAERLRSIGTTLMAEGDAGAPDANGRRPAERSEQRKPRPRLDSFLGELAGLLATLQRTCLISD